MIRITLDNQDSIDMVKVLLDNLIPKLIGPGKSCLQFLVTHWTTFICVHVDEHRSSTNMNVTKNALWKTKNTKKNIPSVINPPLMRRCKFFHCQPRIWSHHLSWKTKYQMVTIHYHFSNLGNQSYSIKWAQNQHKNIIINFTKLKTHLSHIS